MAFTCSPFIRAAAAALALIAANAVHAVVYKWVEEDGKVIYSNERPADPSRVAELSRIDDLELVPADTEPPSNPESSSAGGTAAGATAGPLSREPVTLIPREPVTLLPREPVTLLPKEPEAQAEPPQRVFPRSTHTGAVQDPCLLSPDPRCHELNKAHYHPYAGYTPPGDASPQAVGASGAPAGGGAIGGKIPATRTSAAPAKGGAQALPSGSAAPFAIEWTKAPR